MDELKLLIRLRLLACYCEYTIMTLVISTKINLKVEDDPIAKEVQRKAFAPTHFNVFMS